MALSHLGILGSWQSVSSIFCPSWLSQLFCVCFWANWVPTIAPGQHLAPQSSWGNSCGFGKLCLWAAHFPPRGRAPLDGSWGQFCLFSSQPPHMQRTAFCASGLWQSHGKQRGGFLLRRWLFKENSVIPWSFSSSTQARMCQVLLWDSVGKPHIAKCGSLNKFNCDSKCKGFVRLSWAPAGPSGFLRSSCTGLGRENLHPVHSGTCADWTSPRACPDHSMGLILRY